MLKLGLLGTNQEIHDRLATEKYNIININEKKQLRYLNGLLLLLDKKDNLGQIIEWLLKCQQYPSLFVWVYSSIQLGSDADTLIKLGANEVISTEENLSTMKQIISNTFRCVEHIIKLNTNRKHLSANQFLCSRNQSVLIDGKEFPMTKKEFQLLTLLAENQNTVVSYKQIMNELWPDISQIQIYKIANIIFHIRTKVITNPKFNISTVRSKGYMWVTSNK